MSVTRIATRYAKSLIDLSSENNKLEEVLSDIKDFSEAVKNRDLFLLIKSPIINQAKKAKIFDTIFGDKYSEITNSFFQIIMRKGREMYLPEIADQFIEQYKAIKHITTVKLTTAIPINEKQLKEIKDKLLASDVTDKNIEIITEVDPNIVGGFLIEIGDKLYDASVKHNLEVLSKEFADNLFVQS